ncbi:MAG TPA: hypothetical protein VMM60_00645 [Ilumatobacter sp.]|nr:hypothetical protein [Ilumatobacter sp.]
MAARHPRSIQDLRVAFARREINPPGIADVKRMLELADDDEPEYGALLRVLTATGARRGRCAVCVGPTSTEAHGRSRSRGRSPPSPVARS